MDNLRLLFDAPLLPVQLLLDGVLIGAIFALAALGMALVWGVMGIINVAQGELVMLGGYAAYFLYRAGIHPLFGVPLAAALLFCLGWALYRLLIFRVVDQDLFISILATFGLSILLQQLANAFFGADVRTAESGFGTWAVRGEGNQRDTSRHPTQSDAIDRAREIAVDQRAEVVIHRPDGRIRDKDSYGNDPNPPRDRRH